MVENKVPLGPYRLLERQDSQTFFNHYEFYDRPDSIGSAGRNVYVSKQTAEHFKEGSKGETVKVNKQ